MKREKELKKKKKREKKPDEELISPKWKLIYDLATPHNNFFPTIVPAHLSKHFNKIVASKLSADLVKGENGDTSRVFEKAAALQKRVCWKSNTLHATENRVRIASVFAFTRCSRCRGGVSHKARKLCLQK